ncbi:cysteine--tRNA ligase [Vulcanisaeta thermophila]|uniref:cysteine--tRNA ligase n=1 Tax=Vulcanisaeta thermophila TaxID=867917 RepID=UPI000852FA89
MNIYNTASRSIERLTLQRPGLVRIYTCGLTPYDSMHVGHARVFVFFDIFRRYLEYLGLEVRFVTNFTDIDDKIINRARQEFGDNLINRWYEVPSRYIREFFDAMDKLYIKRAYAYPKVTENINDMIKWIQDLVNRGLAYVSPDGSVYFDITRVPRYGEFSGQRIEELIAGARVQPEPGKKNPLDFALWKSWSEGEPWWSSPWSPGRPGWHLECVVMSSKYLGVPFDIHGGGQDLIFPHHENEIAIARVYYGIDYFARYWVHVGLVTIKGQKMSKSLGNIIPIMDVLSKYDGEVLRLYYAMTQYRKPMDFDPDALGNIRNALMSLYAAYDELLEVINEAPETGGRDQELLTRVNNFINSFEASMNNDMNTGEAVASLMEFSRYITSNVIYNAEHYSKQALTKALEGFMDLAGIIGLLNRTKLSPTLMNLVTALINVRSQLRARKMYDLADQIRDELGKLGVVVSDVGNKTYWYIDRDRIK